MMREGLKFIVAADANGLGRLAAEIIERELRAKPRMLLCASAGGTPTMTYARLAKKAANALKAFRQLRILQIDEWAGLPPDHPATCYSDLRTKLLDPLQISRDRYVGFESDADDPAAECGRVAKWLAGNGPVDVCILGLGLNGHVAMNEPAPWLAPHAHVATLAPGSRNHALLQGLARKPRHGLTLGMNDILCSRKVLLLVSGENKRPALTRVLRPEVTTRFPASFLWLHPDATVICDRAAAPQGLKQFQLES